MTQLSRDKLTPVQTESDTVTLRGINEPRAHSSVTSGNAKECCEQHVRPGGSTVLIAAHERFVFFIINNTSTI